MPANYLGWEMKKNNLIVGFGGLGLKLAQQCLTAGDIVTGLARSESLSNSLKDSGLEFFAADLDRLETLAQLDVEKKQIYFFAPPSRQDDTDHRMRHFLAGIAGQKAEKILYISTTAVYGNSHGDWVSESSPVEPTTARGRRRLDAEQQLQKYASENNVPVVILRVGGIYGPDRLPLRQLESGRPVLIDEDSGFTNRIHVDDLANICLVAMERGEGIYNVSDGIPGTMAEYFISLAEALGYPVPERISLAEAREIMSPEMMSYLEESRRLDITRLREELGVELMYPDLAAGIRQILESR